MADLQLKYNASYSSIFTGDNTDTQGSVTYDFLNFDTGTLISSGGGNATWNGSKWQYTISSVPNISPSGCEVLYDLSANLTNSLDVVSGSATGSYVVAYVPPVSTPEFVSGDGSFSSPLVANNIFGDYTFSSDDNFDGFIFMEFEVPAGSTGDVYLMITGDGGANYDTLMYGDINGTHSLSPEFDYSYCDDDDGGSYPGAFIYWSRLDSSTDWGTLSPGDKIILAIAEWDGGCGQSGYLNTSTTLTITFDEE